MSGLYEAFALDYRTIHIIVYIGMMGLISMVSSEKVVNKHFFDMSGLEKTFVSYLWLCTVIPFVYILCLFWRGVFSNIYLLFEGDVIIGIIGSMSMILVLLFTLFFFLIVLGIIFELMDGIRKLIRRRT